MRAVIHGSFRRCWDEIALAHELLSAAGVEVIAPQLAPVADERDGFVLFEGEEGLDPRLVELRYLHRLKRLGRDGFSLFVCPQGRLGLSASYELAVAQLLGVRCFATCALRDHPAYLPASAIWSAADLASYVREHGQLPPEVIDEAERSLQAALEGLLLSS